MNPTTLNYVVFDLEATCWEHRKGIPAEIIEIGAVLYVLGEGHIESLTEFQAFVQPKFSPTLSAFCTSLTSIAQDQVDGADSFPDVLRSFYEWAEKSSPYKLASWGDYDRKQLARDCAMHEVPNPFHAVEHINLKSLFAHVHGMKKAPGLGKALRQLGLKHQGTAHRGIDDVRNIVQILSSGLASFLE